MQMWASSTTVGIITLLLVSVGCIAGCVALFISGNWLHCWSSCMVDLLVTLLCISVCADEDLEKYVLETSNLCCTMFKLKCPADTEDEALIPGSEEVIVKKAVLVTVQKQMAALVRGEDPLASQPGAREVQDVPYMVPVVGGEDTKCPICHLVFMTPY